MVDHIVDASERRGGVDIRFGYAPGVVVWEVARRHDITPQHLFAWRHHHHLLDHTIAQRALEILASSYS
jgi:transposase-like protein